MRTKAENSYLISACQTAVHKKCHDKFLTKCPGSGRLSESTMVGTFWNF